MNPEQARTLIGRILTDIEDPTGVARVTSFRTLRHVDAKIRETKMIAGALSGVGESLAHEMDADPDFDMNSRRVRLEALAGYCRTVLGFLDAGAIQRRGRQKIVRAPRDIARLTAGVPDLDGVISERWLEAQKCQHANAYLAAVIMMGSILEALLLARATMSPQAAYGASAAVRNQPLPKWTLNTLIDVSAELGWIKSDRKSFGHALRDSRNVVHPWHHVTTKANFDKSTCVLCWQTLRASVHDLIASV